MREIFVTGDLSSPRNTKLFWADTGRQILNATRAEFHVSVLSSTRATLWLSTGEEITVEVTPAPYIACEEEGRLTPVPEGIVRKALKCSACGGSGWYVGFFEKKPCPDCDGSGYASAT